MNKFSSKQERTRDTFQCSLYRQISLWTAFQNHQDTLPLFIYHLKVLQVVPTARIKLSLRYTLYGTRNRKNC